MTSSSSAARAGAQGALAPSRRRRDATGRLGGAARRSAVPRPAFLAALNARWRAQRGQNRWSRWRASLVPLAGVLAVAGALAAGVAPAGAVPGQGGEEPGKVVVVSLPTLRWEDVVEHRPEAILDLVGRSAIASTSVRTIGAETSAGEAYATIGAGNRASAAPEIAGLAYEPSATVEGGTAGEVYERRTDQPVDGADVVHLGIARVQRSAERLRYDAEPGALGQALEDEGLSAAVVANADLPETDVADVDHREAALAVMDEDGRVAGGTVAPDLLSPHPAAAFGTQLDLDATRTAVGDAMADNDVVLVEASDLARVDGYWSWMTPDAAREARGRAITAADRLVAELTELVDVDRDVLMLVGPTSPSSTAAAQLTVFGIAGPDIDPGLARSGTTRRAGYVTLTDIAPTVLDRLDVDRPDSMTGTPITSAGGGAPSLADVDDLAETNELAVFRDRAVGPTSVVYIVVQVAFYALAVVGLVRGASSRWRRAVLGGTLWVLAIPPLGFLSGLVRYDALPVGGYVVLLLVAAAALAASAWWLFRRWLLGPPLALTWFTLAVLLVDVVTGARLQINTVFGYSPTVAGRFAGFGNLAFALVGICAVTVATALWATARLDRPEADAASGVVPREPHQVAMDWSWWVAAVLLAVTTIVVGAPPWGSDVGGVLASVPAFGAVLLALAGLKLHWRRLVLLGIATVGALALFAAFDLSRPEEQRTHLGRFVQRIGDGGAGTIVSRKIGANVDILTSTVWAWLIPAGLVFMVLVLRRDRGLLQTVQRRVPGFRAFLVGSLIVAVLGMAVNDSGVAVPAMMFGVALPYLTYVVIRSEQRPVLAASGQPPEEADAGPVAEPVDGSGLATDDRRGEARRVAP